MSVPLCDQLGVGRLREVVDDTGAWCAEQSLRQLSEKKPKDQETKQFVAAITRVSKGEVDTDAMAEAARQLCFDGFVIG